MIYEVTQFGLPKNIAAGVTEALRQMQPGDTLHFPKGEYHFYKDYCQSLVVHTSNTDSFQRPKKTFGILLQDKEQLTLDGTAPFLCSTATSALWAYCGVGRSLCGILPFVTPVPPMWSWR